MSLRRRAVLELCLLAILTVIFLLLFPLRPSYIDVGLALLALCLLMKTARFTKREIWRFDERNREGLRMSYRFILSFTVPVVILFLLIGSYLGFRDGSWSGALERVLNWRILLALLFYFPWALLQETLFQFYLLGRLKVIFDSRYPVIFCAINGSAYSLVHLPDIWVCLATSLAGVLWSYCYFRYRYLVPIALSHALLGTTFFYWVFGQDIVSELTGKV